jgi:hypothetical protein
MDIDAELSEQLSSITIYDPINILHKWFIKQCERIIFQPESWILLENLEDYINNNHIYEFTINDLLLPDLDNNEMVNIININNDLFTYEYHDPDSLICKTYIELCVKYIDFRNMLLPQIYIYINVNDNT